jgi:hypothetical protein
MRIIQNDWSRLLRLRGLMPCERGEAHDVQASGLGMKGFKKAQLHGKGGPWV